MHMCVSQSIYIHHGLSCVLGYQRRMLGPPEQELQVVSHLM